MATIEAYNGNSSWNETGQRTGVVTVGANGVVTVILDGRDTVAAFPNKESLGTYKNEGKDRGAHIFGVMPNTIRAGVPITENEAKASNLPTMSNEEIEQYLLSNDPAAHAQMIAEITSGIAFDPQTWAAQTAYPLPTAPSGTPTFGESSTVLDGVGQFRLVGVRGRYASGEFKTEQILWTYDSHSGITGDPREIVDGMHIIASEPITLNVAWGGRDE